MLEMAYLNSYYQTGLKNLLDVAVLEHVEVHRELNVGTAFNKVDEIPFDFTRLTGCQWWWPSRTSLTY